jgi:uncharacterized protein with NRDE domain
MCLLVLAWRDQPGSRLLLLGNRDELHARPTRAAGWWDDAPQLLAGRDLEAGGTWLGVTRSGRFAVVTNVREADPPTLLRARSRGELVADFLRGTMTPERYVAGLGMASFAGYNLICGDGSSLWYASNRAVERALAPGVYALSNATLDVPWPKVERLRARFAAARDAGEPALFELLADRTPAADAALPDTGLGAARERLLSAPFVADRTYGTRASYLLSITASGPPQGGGAGPRAKVRFVERGFDRDARPLAERAFDFELAPGAKGAGA